MQKFLHFRKVHARTYKKHIYNFFISPIDQKLFAIEEKNCGCYSPLSSIFKYFAMISLIDFLTPKLVLKDFVRKCVKSSPQKIERKNLRASARQRASKPAS